MKRLRKVMSIKRVAITALLLIPVSSVVSVAALTALARERSRDDLRWALQLRWREQFALPESRVFAQELPAQQTPPATPAPQTPQPSEPAVTVTGVPAEFDYELWERSRNAFRLGQDLVVGPDDVVRDGAVVFGDARVSGRVMGDLVVIFGAATIERTAVIDGDFVAIGGGATVEPGASVDRDVVVIGGPFDAPADFGAGGGQIVIGSEILGGSLEAVVPYLSRGLLWGRIIVPDLPWIWGVVSLFFLLYAALNLIFDRPVVACANTQRTRPLTAFGTGLLVLLLIGPVCLLLAVSVIGIAVVPFVICALIAGGLIGKVAVARSIGMTAIPEGEDGSRAQGARSFVIGFAVLCIAYMIPVLGLITWAIGSVLGLGSAALAFMTAYRRENPAKPVVMVPPAVAPSPPSPPYVPSAPAPGTSAFDRSAAEAHAAPPPIAPPAPPQQTPSAGYTPYAAAAVPAGAASGLLVAQPRALFRDRLAAFVLDVILVMIAASFLDSLNMVDDAAFWPLLLVYFIGMWTWKQTTFGGVVCQLRLVRTDGTPLSFADALVRGLAGIFSLAVLAVGALWILRDPERQAWHDKIAGTYVVKVPRNWPL